MDEVFHETVITDWPHFRDCVDAAKGKWIFRGVSNVTWSNEPSLTRLCTELDEKRAEDVEKTLRAQFDQRVHLFLEPNDYLKTRHPMVSFAPDEFGLNTYMQHFGAPTRLLDWTESPFIGLYFAVRETPDKDAAVWALSRNDLNEVVEKKNRLSGVPALRTVDESKNARSMAQQGLFTSCEKIKADHVTVARESRIKTRMWRIPVGLKSHFLSELAYMGITAVSLFPGIDGLGQFIKERGVIRACELERESE